MPARIVTSTYRYKRPPRKRKAVPLEGPVIITSVDPKKSRRLVRDQAAVGGETSKSAHHLVGEAHPNTAPERRRDPVVTAAGKAPTPANDDPKPAIATKPAIVTTASRKRRIGDGPPQMELPLSRQPVERDGDDYKRLKAAMARRLRSE